MQLERCGLSVLPEHMGVGSSDNPVGEGAGADRAL